jgi:UrcA family protein
MTSATSSISDLLRASAALTACLIVGASATAYAADPAPSVRVNYHDLNLATEQGTQALYERIVLAAHRVCVVSDFRIFAEFAAAHACEAQAIAHAVRDVNNPRLAAVYSAHQRQG